MNEYLPPHSKKAIVHHFKWRLEEAEKIESIIRPKLFIESGDHLQAAWPFV